MPIVVDASVVVGVALDEKPEYSAAVVRAIDQAFVPRLFWFELRNALVINERRSRLTVQQSSEFLVAVSLMPFEIDDDLNEAHMLAHARQHALTVYDAAYLELAHRRNLPLATLDAALIRAAAGIGVTVWQP